MTLPKPLLLVLFWGATCIPGAGAQSSFSGLSVGPLVFQGGPSIGAFTADPTLDVVELSRPLTGSGAACVAAPAGGSGGCSGSGFTLPLDAFASQPGLQQLASQINAINAQLAAINGQIAHNRSIAAQGIALGSAISIVPPNAADRFSLTFGGAGFDGQGAASVSAAYRPAASVLLFGGYARSSYENLIKGGVSFSFP